MNDEFLYRADVSDSSGLAAVVRLPALPVPPLAGSLDALLRAAAPLVSADELEAFVRRSPRLFGSIRSF